MIRVCVVTGSRAEYGLLRPLLARLKQDHFFDLRIVAIGAHLSPEFGFTYLEIEKDGFSIDERIEVLMSSDTPVGVSKTMGLTIIGFAEYLSRTHPDLVVLLGDRYEVLAVACAATVARVPIAHIHGGEVTEGAVDDAFRHAITKMSYLHFTSTEEYRSRVIQLGEDPLRVFNVGALGIENIKKLDLLSRAEVEEALGFELKERTVLVTFHPVTLEFQSSGTQLDMLLGALDEAKVRIIFTKANADAEGRLINSMIDDYVRRNSDKAIAVSSLGQLLYLSAMQYVDAVVGNSSSGIIEAPSLQVPTVNIGDRQKGRVRAESIIDCPPTKEQIFKALQKAFSVEFRDIAKTCINPYENGNASRYIMKILRNEVSAGLDVKKTFYDIGAWSDVQE